MTEFRGAFTALVTPMTETGEVDYEGFRRLVQFQIAEGIDGIVPMGTTGENPTLDESEEDKLIEIAVKEAAGKIKVIVGAGSNDTRNMIKYVQRAKNMGADAALVVTPYYNKPNDDGLLRHFEAAANIGIPIIVYNIASRTGRNIQTSLMKEIANLPNIAGVKESSGDIGQIGDVIREISIPRTLESSRKNSNNKFWVLSGDDAFTLPLISLGGDGVISVVSNLIPAKVKALTKAALEGRFDEARNIHYELLPLIRAAFVETNPVPIKQALTWAGLPAGPARLPLGKLAPASEAALKKTLTEMKLIK
ncbi:MAG: 4-hydroxy-tetrahydrodipicolinate synthase [Treponema sp.]|nr:4-hydroxy-tetrahydrodipicolinate synthase [Treponema sp.]